MSTFHTYDPRTSRQQSQPKACEACYVGKVKCDVAPGSERCKNCIQHGTECRPRARKRKGGGTNTTGLSQTDTSNLNLGLEPSRTNTSRKRQRSDAPVYGDAEAESTSDSLVAPPAPALQNSESIDLSAPFLFVGHQSGLDKSPSTTADAASSHTPSYLSRSAILGNDFPGIDHSHVEQSAKQHKLSSTELKVLELYGAFDLPELPLRQSLVEAFYEKCWTWMPVVDLPSLSDEVSLLPLQAIMLVGALMRPDTCSKASCDTYYHRVKSLVHSGYERNPLNILAALCLVQYYTPTAPKDVSVDTPRFWWSCALGIAQQIGLHRQPARRGRDYGLRRRIWWTLYARDSLMSSAHGRPRLLRLADSNMDPPSVHDFPDPNSTRAQIFVSYVAITEIMCDLCELLVKSNPLATEAREQISQRLLDFVQRLPEGLKLSNGEGLQRPYDFELAQLHVPLLTTITILYRPHSVFTLNPSNAAGVTAAYLNFRILQAIQLREQTRFLSSSFSWYLLVTAIPHLSSLRIPALCKEANTALDAVEGILATLGTVRPSATTNLQNVKAIRRALSAPDTMPFRDPRPGSVDTSVQDPSQSHMVRELLGIYGPQALRNFDSVLSVIGHARNTAHNSIAADLDGMTGENLSSRQNDMQYRSSVAGFDADVDVEGALDSLFGTQFQESMWMRNWIDELQYFPES